jgi:hypothetical protein
MRASNSCSKATWDPQIAFLKPSEKLKKIPRSLQEIHCSSNAALEQFLNTTARKFKEVMKILKHIARGKKRLINKI